MRSVQVLHKTISRFRVRPSSSFGPAATSIVPIALPSVSVVLGSYNRRHLLEAAVESVRNNGLTAPYEMIVVDGGSSDGSIGWLTEQKDIITIVQHNRGEFRGKAIARQSWGYFMNLAFKAAKADWVLMISDDCLLLPGAIAESLDRAASLQAAGRKVGGVAYYFRNWPQEQRYYVQKTIGARLMVNHGLFARQALETVGYVDESTFAFYKADGDLALRIWDAGYEIIDSPTSLVEHLLDDREVVRQSNNLVLDLDRQAYSARWGHLIGKPTRIESDAVDPDRTAERVFGPIRARAQEVDS